MKDQWTQFGGTANSNTEHDNVRDWVEMFHQHHMPATLEVGGHNCHQRPYPVFCISVLLRQINLTVASTLAQSTVQKVRCQAVYQPGSCLLP